MLVHYRRGFVLKGYADFTERKFFKKVTSRHPIYISSGVSGICDEADVEAEVAKKIKLEMQDAACWGDNFSGWLEICTDASELGKAYPYSDDEFIRKMCLSETIVTPVKEWTMKKIIENLNGVQFAQFCKENDISGIIL